MKKPRNLSMSMLKSMMFAFISFFFFFHLNTVYAAGQKNTVTINAKNVSIIRALDMIRDASKMKILYSPDEVDKNKTVSLNLKNSPVYDAVESVIKGQNLALTIEGDRIIISKKEDKVQSKNPRQKIQGFVKDKNGNLLPGVNIAVKGSMKGEVTLADGSFSVEGKVGDELVFTFVGFRPLLVTLKSMGSLNVILQEDAKTIDEVVVVGYGTTTKSKNVVSVTSVNTEKLQNLGLVNITDGLAGRVSGLIVTQSGGGPGSSSSISIRGGGAPIYVIDGIESTQFDFNSLNASDIENISFLKDGAATAVYGAKAGNGIVLVKTKHGSKDKMAINYSYGYDISESTYLPTRLNSYEYVSTINQAARFEGAVPKYADEVVQKYKDQSDPLVYPDNNWRDLILNKTAPQFHHNLSMNGGSEKMQYFASFGYLNQQSLFKFDTKNLQRYNYRLTLSGNFEKTGIKTLFSMYGTTEQQRNLSNQYTSSDWPHTDLPPTQQAFADLEHTKYINTVDHGLVEIDPRSGYRKNQDFTLKTLFNVEWNVPWVSGLSFKANAQVDQYFGTGENWKVTAPQWSKKEDGTLVEQTQNQPQFSRSSSDQKGYTFQSFVDYKKTLFESHEVSLMYGYEEKYFQGRNFSASRSKYDLLVPQLFAGPESEMKNNGSAGEEASRSMFGRFTYNFRNKYLVEGSFRRDESDWFPKGKRIGFFPGAAIGWVISRENFMRFLDEKNILNNLKLKASYGEVGQIGDDTPRFLYVPGYTIGGSYIVGGNIKNTLNPPAIPSPDISWYTQHSSNVGLEFSSLNSHLSGSLDYFYIKTTGFLASPSSVVYSDPLGTDLPTIKSNGAKRRAGFDFGLNYSNNLGKLQYRLGMTYTYFNELWEVNPYESLVDLKNPFTRTTHQTDYYGIGYHSLGLYQNSDQILNNPRRLSSILSPGDVIYEDTNGDGQLDASDQRRIGKSNFPRSNYGVSVELKYNQWSFDMLVQGSGRRSVSVLGTVGSVADGLRYSYQTENRWSVDSPGAQFPRIVTSNGVNGNNNIANSDAWIINASYLRLKSVRLSYDFKKAFFSHADFITDLRLTVSGSNLLTLSKTTKYNFDPETSNSYPIQRVFSFALNVGF